MKEIQDEVRIAAMKRFEQYEAASVSDMPIFKQIGMKMVMFGMQEPKLYQLLLMQHWPKIQAHCPDISLL